MIRTDGTPTIAWASFKRLARDAQPTTQADPDPIVEIDCVHWLRELIDLEDLVAVSNANKKEECT